MAKQAMTKDEIIELLNALTDGDQESAHGKADILLTDALLMAGMGDVVCGSGSGWILVCLTWN